MRSRWLISTLPAVVALTLAACSDALPAATTVGPVGDTQQQQTAPISPDDETASTDDATAEDTTDDIRAGGRAVVTIDGQQFLLAERVGCAVQVRDHQVRFFAAMASESDAPEDLVAGGFLTTSHRFYQHDINDFATLLDFYETHLVDHSSRVYEVFEDLDDPVHPYFYIHHEFRLTVQSREHGNEVQSWELWGGDRDMVSWEVFEFDVAGRFKGAMVTRVADGETSEIEIDVTVDCN